MKTNQKKKQSLRILFFLAIALFILPTGFALQLSKDLIIQNTCLSYNFTIISNSTVDSLTINSTCQGDVNNITFFVNPTLLAIKNTNVSGNGIFQVSGTSILATNGSQLCNGTTGLVTGQVNITLNPNEFCYVLDDFNLTEGQVREYSPMSIIRDNDKKVRITSTIVDNVIVLVKINNKDVYGDDCENVNKVTYTTNSGVKIVYSDKSAIDVCKALTTTGYELTIEQASGSNSIEIDYAITSLARSVIRILVGFLALSVLGVALIFFFWFLKNNFSKIDLIEFFKYCVLLLIAVVLYLALINYIVTEVL